MKSIYFGMNSWLLKQWKSWLYFTLSSVPHSVSSTPFLSIYRSFRCQPLLPIENNMLLVGLSLLLSLSGQPLLLVEAESLQTCLSLLLSLSSQSLLLVNASCCRRVSLVCAPQKPISVDGYGSFAEVGYFVAVVFR